MTIKNRFEINHAVNLADIGSMINSAIAANEEGNPDALRDYLFDVHSLIYPNASRIATLEESIALAAAAEEGEKHHGMSATDTIQIGRLHLSHIAEEFSKIGSIVDFVAIQLERMHNENQDIPGQRPATTLYQLHAMLEGLDGRIMDRETALRGLLGDEEE